MQNFSELNFELKTARLLLRPLKASDAEILWPHVSDPDLPEYMSWETHQDLYETREFLERCERNLQEGTGITWGIFEDDVFCGLIGLDGITHKIQAVQVDQAELGYWLGKQFRKQGIMTEAVETILAFGFGKLGLHKITVGHFSENTASRKVIEKLGFRLIGEQKEQLFKNSKWHDHKIYELLSADFYKR